MESYICGLLCLTSFFSIMFIREITCTSIHSLMATYSLLDMLHFVTYSMSIIDGHSSCFELLVSVTSATVNIYAVDV